MYTVLINQLASRKLKLGLSDSSLARRSGVSQSVVHRILAGKHATARFDQVLKIAKVLGMECVFTEQSDASTMRYEQARTQAQSLMDMTQATMALEGQGLDAKARRDLMEEDIHQLLAGPDSKLWSE